MTLPFAANSLQGVATEPNQLNRSHFVNLIKL
jgi:hypothetical protein